MGTDIWPAVHAERKALAADLGALSDDKWVTPSLCGDWTVRDVLAHMTPAAKASAAGGVVADDDRVGVPHTA